MTKGPVNQDNWPWYRSENDQDAQEKDDLGNPVLQFSQIDEEATTNDHADWAGYVDLANPDVIKEMQSNHAEWMDDVLSNLDRYSE